jgi:hypothetical protein
VTDESVNLHVTIEKRKIYVPPGANRRAYWREQKAKAKAYAPDVVRNGDARSEKDFIRQFKDSAGAGEEDPIHDAHWRLQQRRRDRMTPDASWIKRNNEANAKHRDRMEAQRTGPPTKKEKKKEDKMMARRAKEAGEVKYKSRYSR